MLHAQPGASASPVPATSLTTGAAPFIEDAASRGQLFIAQPYELYSAANQQAWQRLYRRLVPLWDRYANPNFQRGLDLLGLDPYRIPRLADINLRLAPLTGFQARAVAGYVPAYLFFDCLRRREFPTTITIRPATDLDYLPEPDIFHDVAGHVPMHTDPAFAQALAQFGECAHSLAGLATETRDLPRLANGVKAMARLFWFTIEFGLIRAPGGKLHACGSGLLSSFGELRHSIESPNVRREPFSLNAVINQTFDIDHYQPLLFVLDSFDQLYEAAEHLERSILNGTLAQVAPGEPESSEADLASFLSASN